MAAWKSRIYIRVSSLAGRGCGCPARKKDRLPVGFLSMRKHGGNGDAADSSSQTRHGTSCPRLSINARLDEMAACFRRQTDFGALEGIWQEGSVGYCPVTAPGALRASRRRKIKEDARRQRAEHILHLSTARKPLPRPVRAHTSEEDLPCLHLHTNVGAGRPSQKNTESWRPKKHGVCPWSAHTAVQPPQTGRAFEAARASTDYVSCKGGGENEIWDED